MPGLLTNSDDSSTIVPHSPVENSPTVYTIHHNLKPPLTPHISISWSRGNSLRLSIFKSPDDSESESESGGKV
ncbi:hypothetical protein Tco_1195987, partial [Tanacetum coccineum]